MMLIRLEQARKYGPQANADSAIQRWFSAAFQADKQSLVNHVRSLIAGCDPEGYLGASKFYACMGRYGYCGYV